MKWQNHRSRERQKGILPTDDVCKITARELIIRWFDDLKHQLCKSEDVEISLSQSLFHIETQFGVDWAEPGFGTRAYMDCSTSHSEGGAGTMKWSPAAPSRSILAAQRKGQKGGERGGRKITSTLGPNVLIMAWS